MTTERRPLSLDDVAHLPAPGINIPVSVRFSPDSHFVSYLYSSDGTLTRELWLYDCETGEERRLFQPPGGGDSDATVSREEALRRERQRQLAGGVTSYAWSEQGNTLLVPVGGDLWVQNGVKGEPRRVTSGGGCIDPRLSPDGRKVAFVRHGELYALDLTDEHAPPVRLTFDATPAGTHGDRPVTNGLAEFVAQEEMGRSAGFWWSPDGARLAFEQVDAGDVPLFLIPHHGSDAIDVEAHRYPFAGQANVRVRLGVVDAAGGEVAWLPLGDDPDSYLARVHWTPDGQVLAQVQARDQKRLEVRRIDPDALEATTLFVEHAEPWVNLHNDLRVLREPAAPPRDYRLLWSSERSGRRELYLYDRDGSLLSRATDGAFHIDEVRGIDLAGGAVYVEGWLASPLERQMFRVPLAGGPVQQVTREPGYHQIVLSEDCSHFIDTHSSASTPPVVTLRESHGEPVATLQSNAPPDERLAALDLPPPEFVTITARDSETLHGALYRPANLPPGERAPVIVQVYGGPHFQAVADTWQATVSMRAQYLAQQGFLVFKLDNRGSARRGLSFEARIAGNLGDLEVQDQVDGVRYLSALPEADTERVGIYGWSYGGYMALMCLARAPEVFKVAVAGAPVTHWDGYDTHYTERYMGRPEENAEGYRSSSVMAHVAGITGKLLLVHGLIDENVHFRHTARLLSALVAARVPHDLLLFPAERHSPRREEDRVSMEERLVEYFRRYLLDPPAAG